MTHLKYKSLDITRAANNEIYTKQMMHDYITWKFYESVEAKKQHYGVLLPRLGVSICKVYDYFDKFTFLCEMYDENADKIVQLVLNFFPFDNSVQVINTEKKTQLLKRVQLPSLKQEMLQIGNVVNIFSKLLLISGCAPATSRQIFKNVESTFALIKPVPPSEHGKIITYIMRKGFRIRQMKNAKIDKDFAINIYGYMSDDPILPILIDYITNGEVIGLELVAPDAVSRWREALGATDPENAAPGTLRRLYGKSKLHNVAHGCNTSEDAKRLINMFFGYKDSNPIIPPRATFKDCTCCVIKPHAIIDGNLGAIIEHISTAGPFYISAMAMFSVKIPNALEFYEVYKGVLPEYETMATHLAEGKFVVCEIKYNDECTDIVNEFRKLCGPRDPELCRQLYPNSIRALYGKDIVHNAIHCTDLPEDGETEIEYFFKLMSDVD